MKNSKKISSTALKSFIVIAVVIMLLSMMPSEGAVNEKSPGFDEKVISDDEVVDCLDDRVVKCSELSDLAEPVKELSLSDATNANRVTSTSYHQVQSIRAASETEKQSNHQHCRR